MRRNRLGFLAFFTLLLYGCSPGMFFNNDEDTSVSNSPAYHKTEVSCSGIDLSKNKIEVKSFIKIINCLNANRSIDALAKLVNRLDSESGSNGRLQAIVNMLNRYLISDRSLLYQMDQTYLTLAGKQILNETFFHFGRLLENTDFISSSLTLLHEAYSKNATQRKKILEAIEKLSSKVTPDNTAILLDLLIALTNAPSFSALQKRLLIEGQHQRDFNRDLIYPLFSYLRDKDPKHVPLVKTLVQEIGSGKLYKVSDRLLGRKENELRHGVPRVATLFKTLFMRGFDRTTDSTVDGALINGITSLYHYLHRPVECFNGAASVWDTDLNMIRELAKKDSRESAEFYKRQNLLILIGTNSFCDYPPEASRYYPSMIQLSDTPAVDTSTDIVKYLYDEGLSGVLVDLLADTGSDLPGGPAENSAGVKVIFPLLAELTEKNIWDDLFYFATSPTDHHRATINRIFNFILTAPDPIFDTLSDSMLQSTPESFYRFIISFKPFFADNTPMIAPALSGLRKSFYANDAFPVINLIQNMMATASENESYFETLFQIAQMQEFRDFVKMSSEMAKDGRLTEVLGSLLAIFRQYASTSSTPITVNTSQPRFHTLRRHNLSSTNTAPSEFFHLSWDDSDPCRKLDITTPFYRYTDEQIENYVLCFNKNQEHKDVQSAISFLKHTKIKNSDENYFDLVIKIIQKLATKLNQDQMNDFVGRWLQWSDPGKNEKFYDLLDVLPFWINEDFHGQSNTQRESGPVLKAFLNGVQEILSKVPRSFRHLFNTIGKIIDRDDLPLLLKYAENIQIENKPLIERKFNPIALSSHVEQLADWVRTYEPKKDPIKRAYEIFDEYNNAITNNDLVDNKPRRSWKKEEFNRLLDPLLIKMADPKQSVKEKPLSQALLNVMKKFGIDPSDNSNELPSLVQWLRERSHDYTPILYFYPGESCLRVRLVNTLDRFELLLLNANFSLGTDNNFALDFLRQLGEAWGDEPYEKWPVEIQKKYQNKKPLTFAEASQNIQKMLETSERWIGYPKPKKQCRHYENPVTVPLPSSFSTKARVFNLRQVFSVITENTPGVDHPNAGGIKVLRRLFFELHSSSPKNKRGADDGWNNNLSVVTRLVELGLMRQVSRLMMQFPQVPVHPKYLDEYERNQYAALVDFFRTFTTAAITPSAEHLLKALFPPTKDPKLVKALINQLFDSCETPEKTDQLKQLGFYALAQAGRYELVSDGIRAITDIVANGRGYFEKRSERLTDILNNRKITNWIKNLYEDQSEENAEAKMKLGLFLAELLADKHLAISGLRVMKTGDYWFQVFIDRLTELRKQKTYLSLAPEKLSKDVWNFFKEEASPHTQTVIRKYLSQLVSSRSIDQPSDMEELLLMLSRPPLKLENGEIYDPYSFLLMIGKYIKNNDLPELLKYGRRGFSGPEGLQ